MSVQLNAYKGAKIIETLDNYSIAEDNSHSSTGDEEGRNANSFRSDESFWRQVITNPKRFENRKITLQGDFVLSEWVARVPGLYWADYSKSMRRHRADEIAVQSPEWIEFVPQGKSRKVLGGIGTILLPSNDEGKRIVSVSSGFNASSGIPLLIYSDVWEELSLKQGDRVSVLDAKWQPIDVTWAKRFASTSGIPRGYLVIDTVKKLRVEEEGYPVASHPFSVMEYQKDDALLYDFVYLTIDSMVEDEKKRTDQFFTEYAKKEGRNGRYLINPNMIDPLFEVEYMSPTEMQRPGERAQIELLYKRIQNVSFSETTLDRLIQLVPEYYDSGMAIRKLAREVGMSPALLQDDAAATMSAQLINLCMNSNKIEELIDRMAVQYPSIFE